MCTLLSGLYIGGDHEGGGGGGSSQRRKKNVSLNIHLYTLQRFTSIGLYWINTEIKQSTVKTKISKICNEIRGVCEGGGGAGGRYRNTGPPSS